MKNSILTTIALLCLGAACTSSNSKPAEVQPMVGYFYAGTATAADTAPLYLLLTNQQDFDQTFHPAAIMGQMPTQIDFARQVVCALVLPQTAYETSINLDPATLKGNDLNIAYRIEQGTTAQSFEIRPVQLWVFDASIAATQVVMSNKGVTQATLALPAK